MPARQRGYDRRGENHSGSEMRLLVAALLLCFASGASAALRTWPGVAPCNTTLQACLNAAGAGDVIDIATNVPIDESLSTAQSLTIRAANGYSPRLAAGRSLVANPPVIAGGFA